MNANRKADLQRKLAVAPVPKPPAGLAERIKTEIPKELRFDVNRERDRYSRSVRFSLAVAASVIVVISSAFLALRVMNTADATAERKPTAAVPVRIVPPSPPPAAVAAPPLAQDLPKLAVRSRKAQKPAASREVRRTQSLDDMAKNEAAPAAPAPAAAAAKLQIPFKDISRDEQIRILKDRLAHGADPKEIARIARDAGLNDFADEVEKKKP